MRIYLNGLTVNAFACQNMLNNQETNIIRMEDDLLTLLNLTVNSTVKIDNKDYIIKKARVIDLMCKTKDNVHTAPYDVYVASTDPLKTATIISAPNLNIKKEPPILKFNSEFNKFNLGSDPELMIADVNGKAVTADRYLTELSKIKDKTAMPKVFADGFVAELAPPPQSCRALHLNEIAVCLGTLINTLREKGKDLHFSAKSSFPVDRTELEAACERARKFGCDPSSSAQDDVKSSINIIDPRKIDGMTHKKRYAGGHLHIGGGTLFGGYNKNETAKDLFHNNWREMAKFCDLFVGIPATLLDRDASSKERRKLYGRAGEYRLPPHGFEYRVPSNFWLKAPALGTLMLGNIRFTANILSQLPKETKDYILHNTDWELVVEAINTNSFSKAMKAWVTYVRPLLVKSQGTSTYYFDMTPSTLPLFEFVVQKGVNRLWDDDISTNWNLDKKLDEYKYNSGRPGHDFKGWQYTMFTKFCERKNGELELFKEFVSFRKSLRKKGFDVLGADDWSVNIPLCRR